MKIGPINLSKAAKTGQVRLSVRMVSDRRPSRASLLWFDLPEEAATLSLTDGTPWLQMALPWAFHHEEAVEIDAEVDEGWLENSARLMEVYSRWYPGFKPIEIRAAGTRVPTAAPEGRGVGLFFTGGVDSFHTLLSHDLPSPGSEPQARPIQDLIYVSGFDIPVRYSRSLKQKLEILREIADRTEKNLISVSTNLRETFLSKVRWDTIMHGPALGAVGMFLDKRLDTILISAGGGDGLESRAWGSHFLTDPLFSTSRTQVVRCSNKVDRFSKFKVIADCPVAMDHLHVCWVDESHLNCGNCEKCIRSMLSLEILGALEGAHSFSSPCRAMLLSKIKRTRIGNEAVVRFWEILKSEAVKRGRADLEAAIEFPLNSFPSLPPRGRPVFDRLKRRIDKVVRRIRR